MLSWIRSLLLVRDALAKDEIPHEDLDPGSPIIEIDDPDLEPPGIRTVGAWCGLSSLRNAAADIDFALAHGIRRLDVIVNEHSAHRTARPFDTYPRSLILDFCGRAQAAGIELHLMSWIMPFREYLTGAAAQLLSLAQDCGVKSIQWDAEEPWTLARGGMRYEDAAKLVGDLFADRPCEMGVNGIGYTPKAKFGPLADVCDYLVPQCYATSTSNIPPEDAVPRFVRRYREVFGPKKIVAGLAAYRQTGIPRHTVETALLTALAGAQAIEGVDTVVYWSLAAIKRDRRVASVISSILRRPE